MAACASERTITLPPRIEKQRVSADLLAPCDPAGDPAAMTPHAVGDWVPRIVLERDCLADKLNRVREQVEVAP